MGQRFQKVCIDTDVLIDYLKGDRTASMLLERTAGKHEEICITSITVYELLLGVEISGKGEKEVAELLGLFSIIAFDKESASEAAIISAELRRRGESVGVRDELIAGILKFYKIPLLTRNVDHFARVSGLIVIKA